jgi:hypothetical protein
MAKKPLTPIEKETLRFAKSVKKTGKPGDLQKTLDSLSSASKATLARAIKKSQPASRAAKVNKPTKQAKPDAIKVRSRSTGKLVTFNTKPNPRSGIRGGGMLGGSAGGGRIGQIK